jgi:hypothetical protein
VHEDTVESIAHAKLIGHRLDVNIRSPLVDRRPDQLIDQLNDLVFSQVRLIDRVVFDFLVVGGAGLFALQQGIGYLELLRDERFGASACPSR